MHKIVLFICVITQSVFVACSFSKDDAAGGGSRPDTVAINVRQVSVSNNGRVEITADKVEAFYEDDYNIFFNVGFREFNEKSEEQLTGNADRIELEGNGDGIAKGNIIVQNLDDDSELRANLIELNKDDRILIGKGLVQVNLGDGLTIESGELTADLGKKSYTFSNGVRGTLVIDEDEPDNEEQSGNEQSGEEQNDNEQSGEVQNDNEQSDNG